MYSIPAFSKKLCSNGTAGSSTKIRSGFTDNVKISSPAKSTPVKHMAAMYPTKSTLSKTSGAGPVKRPPSFKSHSGAAGKSVAAFSKKKL